MKTWRCVRGVIGGVAVVGLGALAWGAPTFNVSISDPGNAWSSATRAALVAHAQAAAAAWAPSLGGSGSIEILVRTDNSVPRGYGSSVASSFVRSIEGAGPGGGPMFVFEQAMASELRTGVDPNGAAPDVIIGLNTSYVADVLWLDPQPTVRTAPVPSDRTDAMSVFIHELGHALAYNGWSNGIDDTWPSPGDYRSTWDIHLQFDESEGLFRFAGPYASALYGGPVPVTTGNPSHLGNPVGQIGSDLIPELMNGVVFFNGTRYFVGPMDRAILRDCGVTPRCLADIAGANQQQAPDTQLSADDIIVYLSRYFAANPMADIAGANQSTAPDGQLTADDIIVFLGWYFAGC